MVLFTFSWFGSKAQSIIWVGGNNCVGVSDEFVYTGPGTVNTWTITGPGHTIQAIVNPTIHVIFTGPGSASVSCTYNKPTGGTGNATPYNLTVNANGISPSASLSASATSICAGSNVTFTTTASNAGTPSYTWYLNGAVQSGINTASWTTSGITNGQQVYCIVGSSNLCATVNTATTNTITETVNPTTTFTASLTQTGAVCTGQTTTFTATPTVSQVPAGTTYQWFKNGSSITGITGPPANVLVLNGGIVNAGDQIYCKILFTAACYTTPLTSNTVSATFSAQQTFTPTIAVPTISLCQGQSITFTAGGNFPASSYSWTSNGSPVGNTTNTYTVTANSAAQLQAIGLTETTPQNGCISNPTQSTSLTNVPFGVNPVVTPTVSIAQSPTGTVCLGTTTTFTATAAGAGFPTYQWHDAGALVGTNSATYSSGSLTNGEQVYCTIVGNAACATTQNATSNTVTASVNPSVTLTSVTIAESTIPCAGGNTGFQATVQPSRPSDATFLWYVNNSQATNETGVPQGVFVSNTLHAGDQIYCTMTTNTACTTPHSLSSPTIAAAFQSPQPFNVGVGPIDQGIQICPGHSVTLACQTSAPAIPGDYIWTVDGVQLATHESTIVVTEQSVAQMANITCFAQAEPGACLSGFSNTGSTAPIPWFVIPFDLPTIAINESTVIVNGEPQVTFTANTTFGGSMPTYQWQLNGVPVSGASGNVWTTTSLPHNVNNQITATMTASPEICVAPGTVCQNINFVW